MNKYKLIISVVAGLISSFLHVYRISLHVNYQPTDFYHIIGLFLPMIVALSWGYRYVIISLVVSISVHFVFFFKETTSPIFVFSSISVVFWLLLHTFCELQYRKSNFILWNKYIVEIFFRVLNTAALYGCFIWLLKTNPYMVIYEPLDEKVLRLLLQFVALKQVISGFVVLLMVNVFINSSFGRKVLKLPRLINQKATNYILISSIFFSIGFWIVHSFFDYSLFYREHDSFISLGFTNVPLYSLWVRILFVFSFIISGLLVSRFLRMQSVKDLQIKQKEHEIADIKNQLDLFFESNIEGIAAVDIKTKKMKYCNKKIQNMFGYSKEEFLSLEVEDLHPKDKLAYVMNEFNQQVEGKKITAYNISCLRKDGKIFQADIIMAKSTINDREVAFAFFTDCTERIKSEKELLHSEEKFSKAFYNNVALMAITRLKDGQFIDVNEKFCQVTGLSKEEIMGKTSVELNFLTQETREQIKTVLEKEGKIESYEFDLHIDKTNKNLSCLFYGKVIEIKKEKCLLSLVEDITERKKREEQIKTLSKFPSQNPGPVLKVNQNAEVVYANSAVERILEECGFSNKDVFKILPDNLKKIVDKVLTSKEPISDLEVSLKNNFYSYTAAYASQNSVNLYAIDITKRKSIENDLKKNELKFRTFFESMVEGVALCSLVYDDNNKPVDYIFEDINTAFIYNTNLDKEKVIGQRATKVYQTDVPPYFDLYKKVALTKESTYFEMFYAPTKRYFYVSVFSPPEEGKFFTVIQDITDRRRVNLALFESEKRYRTLVEAMSDGLGVQDEDGVFTYVNTALCNMLGYSKYELIGAKINNLLDEENNHLYKEQLEKRKDGQQEPYELIWISKSGEKIYTILSPTALFDTEGNFKGSFAVFTDITQRKKDEEQLNLYKDQLEDLVRQRTQQLEDINDQLNVFKKFAENSAQGLGMADLEGKVTYANKILASMVGYENKEEMLGHNVREYYNDEQRERLEKDILPQVLEKGFCTIESSLLSVNGKEVSTIQSVFLISDDEGNPINIANVITDITERKKVESILSESEEKFSKAFTVSPVLMVINSLDENGKFIEVNQCFLDTLGYTREEVIGKPAGSIQIFVDDNKRQDILKELTEKGSVRDIDVEVKTKKGKIRYGTFSGDIFYMHKKAYSLTVMDDITERKIAEKELRNLNKQLGIINRELESFSYSVSHDLRAPLRAINGFSKILEEDYGHCLDSEGLRILHIVRGSVQTMEHLIEGLLLFARFARKDLNLERINMDILIKEIHQDIKNAFPERKFELVSKNLNFLVGDRMMIRQVFVNLISNAVKFTRKKEHPYIEIGMYSEHNENVYYVKDNGEGFDMRYVDKLFSVFQRLHSSSDFEGTGIGLANVQRIVKRHGGRVWAKGEVNVGATFYCAFPVRG